MFDIKQNFHKTPEWIVQKYKAEHFHQINAQDMLTAIKLKDSGIIGYTVPACLIQAWNQTEPKQPNQLLGRTEPSPSDRVMPLSKLNRACTATKPSRADPPLG